MSLETAEHLETKIVAYIDDELDSNTRTDMSREVMRNPEARQMLDLYETNDELCRQALEALMHQGQPSTQQNEASLPAYGNVPAWRWVGWTTAAASLVFACWGVYMSFPGLMGAIIPFQDPGTDTTIMAAGIIDERPRDRSATQLLENHQNQTPTQLKPVVYAADEYEYGDTLEAESSLNSDTNRYYFGVYDKVNKRFYWLQTQEANDDYEIIEADL